MSLLQRVLRAGEGKRMKELQSVVDRVNALESEMEGLTDDELRARTAWFRERLAALGFRQAYRGYALGPIG